MSRPRSPCPPELTEAAAEGESYLTVRAELAADQPLGRGRARRRPRSVRAECARRDVADQSAAIRAAASRPEPARPTPWGRRNSTCGPGSLRNLYGLAVDGPRLELWRAPTDNDRSDSRGTFELAGSDYAGGEGVPGPSSEQRWRQRGLDRLTHRVREVRHDADQLAVQVRVAAANSSQFVDVSYSWWIDQGLALLVEVTPSSNWDCTWPRVGVRFDLPPELSRASWFGTGPLESYPDTQRAARVGRFAASIDDLVVDYSRPQETGHRAALRSLEVVRRVSGPVAGRHRARPCRGIDPVSRSPGTPRRSWTGRVTRTSSGRVSTSIFRGRCGARGRVRARAAWMCSLSTPSGRARGSSNCASPRPSRNGRIAASRRRRTRTRDRC